jgi:dTDP-4-dehydrorhamnose 3,5-epimerase
MIEGVKIKQLKVIPDERGRLMEILRNDDELFEKFGQAYVTVGYPGIVKAWHYHKKQTDYFCAIYGMMKVVLYDSREGSPTKGEINEFFIGVHNPLLLKIPPMVFHGFKAVGTTEAIILNIPTEPYKRNEPDEYRIDPHKNDIPYNWDVKEG